MKEESYETKKETSKVKKSSKDSGSTQQPVS